MDREGDIVRHVYAALEDEFAQPLEALVGDLPEGFDSFSELEISLSEWSYGYGVAWALVRSREPFLSSSRVAELAAQAVTTAWRTFSEESWRSLIAQDREMAATPRAEPERAPQLDQFMGGLSRARPARRPRASSDETADPDSA